MNREDLQLFMTILEENNLIKAAERLYLSPTTAGSRLRAMEEELGFELFERKKGVKSALPTPKGLAFSHIAAQMLSLWNEADGLTRAPETPFLSIATVDSFLDYNLTPFYRELITRHGFSLEIKCYPAHMIYSLVNSKQADLGFALYHTKCPHVDVTPIMEDEMVLVIPENSLPPAYGTGRRSSLHPPIQAGPDNQIPSVHPASLPPGKELLTGSLFNSNTGWGPEFKLWHDQYIAPAPRPLVTASSISILTGFLEAEDYWTIMPAATARGLKKQYPIKIQRLSPAPPNRTLYMLTHQSPSRQSAGNRELFVSLLNTWLKEHSVPPFVEN